MAETMIERIEQWLQNRDANADPDDGTSWSRSADEYRREALEILAVLREPTEEIVVDALDYEALDSRWTARNVWGAMVDRAVAEGV